jgi:hypothetical protein
MGSLCSASVCFLGVFCASEKVVSRPKKFFLAGRLGPDPLTELFTIGQGVLEPTSVKLVISTALVQAGLIRGVTVFFLLNLPGIIVF